MNPPKNILAFLFKIQLLFLINIVKSNDEWNYSDDLENQVEKRFYGHHYGNHWRLSDFNRTHFHLNRHKREAPVRTNEDFFPKVEALKQTTNEWLLEAWDMHNKLRKLHGIEENLILDGKLTHEAQQWAIELGQKSFKAGKVYLEHDHEFMFSQGEVMGGRKKGSHDDLAKLPGSFPVRIWYEEISIHRWDDNYWTWNTGHFSQVVWAASKKLGCARYITETVPGDCEGEKLKRDAILIMVCRYDPPGNWLSHDAYNSHVRKPLSGDPNAVPDFKQFCPEKTTGCPRPIVCCKDEVSPAVIVNPCGQPKGRSVKSKNGTVKAVKAKGRSTDQVTTSKPKTTPKPKKLTVKPKPKK